MHGCGRILSRQYASAFGRKMGRDRIPQAISILSRQEKLVFEDETSRDRTHSIRAILSRQRKSKKGTRAARPP
jgi:hypothetical protein